MFYSSAWDNEDDVDDWDTDTDAINTENIRSGKSAAESLGGSVPLNAAEAAKFVKDQASSVPAYRESGNAEKNDGPVNRAPVSTPTPAPVASSKPVPTQSKFNAPAPTQNRGPSPQRGAPPARVRILPWRGSRRQYLEQHQLSAEQGNRHGS